MVHTIKDPETPYVGHVDGQFNQGKMVRIQGYTAPTAERFDINLQSGSEALPESDAILHVSVRISEGYIARNNLSAGSWGDEEDKGELFIGPSEKFEIIILCGDKDLKIAVNGRHFCEFVLRSSPDKITHLAINGDVSLSLIAFETNDSTTRSSASHQESHQANMGGAGMPYGAPNQYSGQVPPDGQYGGQYGPPPQHQGYPMMGGGYPQGGYGGPYGPPQGNPYYGGPPPQGQMYGPQQQPTNASGGGGLDDILNSASSIIAGAVASGVADKLIGSLTGGGSSNQHNTQSPPPTSSPLGGLNLGQLTGQGGSFGGLGSFGNLLSNFADQALHPKKDGH